VTLVDTSIWIDYLRAGNTALADLLLHRGVLGHPSVTGELDLGNLHNRYEILGLLRALPPATVAEDAEVSYLIEHERLAGTGIGYVDAQILAATRLTSGATLWSGDKRLKAVARRLGLEYLPG
jgi:predicted nucleic acid-binding protein